MLKKKKKDKRKGWKEEGKGEKRKEEKATEEVVGEGEALRNQGEFVAHSRSAGRRL